jgi:TctA family transporter
LRPLSPVPTYFGIGISAIGFVLIAIAWGQVAGETRVAFQLPYLVSGGITGLALVMVGMTIISVAARRRDAALREQQTGLLADALRELAISLEERRGVARP